MWPWQQQTVIQDNFSARVHRVEADCLRRLDFVEAQLGRVQRPNRRWDSHMTVVDADIRPVGPLTYAFNTVSDVHAWRWWMYVIVGVAALVVVRLLVAVF
jgi:hypothetical protein